MDLYLSPPSYVPDGEIIRRYAQVFVRSLWGGHGVSEKDIILCRVPEVARPMYAALEEALLRARANPYMRLLPNGLSRTLYEHGSEEQLKFVPTSAERAIADLITGRITVTPLEIPGENAGISADKLSLRQSLTTDVTNMTKEREAAGLFTWTLGDWPTEKYAQEARMSLQEYWEQVIYACYLDDPDPSARWKETFSEIHRVCAVLNAMDIDSLHVEGDDINLYVPIGDQRKWEGGSGRNIPSYEIFTTPDYRGIDGFIRFNNPVFYQSVMIEGIALVFKNGEIVSATADTHEDLLHKIIALPDGNHVGEFSLTDSRLSRITKYMARNLFVENLGGPQGNTHIALGSGSTHTFTGTGKMKTEDWEALGFNPPSTKVHVDIVSTTRRAVTAYLKDGTRKVIYRDGQFLI
jgi:aminopeptidase